GAGALARGERGAVGALDRLRLDTARRRREPVADVGELGGVRLPGRDDARRAVAGESLEAARLVLEAHHRVVGPFELVAALALEAPDAVVPTPRVRLVAVLVLVVDEHVPVALEVHRERARREAAGHHQG